MLLRVHSPVADPEFLKGKYSELFIAEMKRQLEDRIARAMSVEGLDSSTVELQLVFAPGTYMEHTSESVTYRRLLITDKSCGVRDFWVKWTRLDGEMAYTVSDDVTEDNILFELGEDVPQKIREKEYRFLAAENPDKYQSAMSRKTVTEWRDLIKRAIKKGTLKKIDCEPEIPVKDDVSDQLKALLSSYGIEPREEEKTVEDDSFDSIMELARAALGRESAEENEEISESYEVQDTEDTDADSSEDIEVDLPWNTDETSDTETEEKITEIGEEPSPDSLPDLIEDESDEPEHLTIDEALKVLDDEPAEEPAHVIAEPVIPKRVVVTGVTEESAPKGEFSEDVTKLLEERIKKEIEAKLRLEYEEEARARAEMEAENLRREKEKLRLENERLARLAREAEEERLRRERELVEAEQRHKREEEELRQKIEAQLQREARERDRLAEAARQALLEHRRQEEEKAREEEPADTEAFDEPTPETVSEPIPEPKPQREEYVTKHARLIFRSSTELGIINRIKTIIEDTLVANGKTDVDMHIKAYAIDPTTIGLDIVRMPQTEGELLVTIMKTLGNSRLGITKITVE